MFTLIKNAEVYTPDYEGKRDILLTGAQIGYMEHEIRVPEDFVEIKVIEASGKILSPGFIDGHVHLIGGGGEGGYKTRTPEIQLTDATLAGITTLVGVIGTDGTTRSMAALLAKAKALKEEGISCYVHTGSYQIPVKTLTGKIEDDIILVEEIIGAGEIAIADHRSSQPTVEEFARIASEARNGGLLSGKAGIVNVHLGDSLEHLKIIEEAVEYTELPITQFYPTHINRNHHLFHAGIAFAKKGGWIDFTTSTVDRFLAEGEIKASRALRLALEHGLNPSRITFTSDGQASLPDFDMNGRLIGLSVGKCGSLHEAVVDAILNEHVPVEHALRAVTANPAAVNKLESKGRIAPGMDADLVLLDKGSLAVDTVIARGRILVEEGIACVKGTFE